LSPICVAANKIIPVSFLSSLARKEDGVRVATSTAAARRMRRMICG